MDGFSTHWGPCALRYSVLEAHKRNVRNLQSEFENQGGLESRAIFLKKMQKIIHFGTQRFPALGLP